MALFDTYAQGLVDIAAWLKRDDLTDQIPNFIRMGELRIYRDLRVRAMEASLSTAIASGVVAVPSGYVGMKYAYLNSSPIRKLERKDAEWIHHNYPTRAADGVPKFFARDADSFIFGPYPDSAYTMKGTYYKRLPALSALNTSNWFTENAPDLLLYASLISAEPYCMNDERLVLWKSLYEEAGQRIQYEDTNEEFSGSPLEVTPR
jgi:hypothetical protein